MTAGANAYSSDWFSLFLRELPPERTAREAELVHGWLPPGSRILDLPCGDGRHARLLAARGHRVTAIDRALPSLRPQPAPRVDWLAADLRRLPLRSGSADAVVCLWQSFGFFAPEENAAVLREWARVTRPDGLLVLDLYDRRYFEASQGERRFEQQGRTVREIRTVTGGRLVVELHYGDGGGDRFDWQLFTPDELIDFAGHCGWERRRVCAGFDPAAAPDGSQPRVQYLLVRR